MLLYHGTSERVGRLVIQEGLRPRGETGCEGNWKHTVDSSVETVHLTSAYAGYFAGCASGEGERWAIIEVDADPGKLAPDEDYMEQATRERDMRNVMSGLYDAPVLRKGSMEERTQWFRDHIREFQAMWQKSLDGLGNVAHLGAIEPARIKRVALVDPRRTPLAFRAMDPTITPMNYQILGPQYRALTQWLVGRAVPAQELFGLFWEGMDEGARIQAAKWACDTEVVEVIHKA